MTTLISELRERNLIQDFSDEEGINTLSAGSTFYVGFDPTAPYLHIGNLVPLLICLRLARRGFKPIILFGGSTGAIGDPSGRSKERTLLSRSELDTNIERQSRKVREIFARQGVEVTFVNNLDWTRDITILDFLRDIGKHFTVNFMIAKEVIKSRLDGDGISFTEFSYMLLQAFDFYYLYENHQCKLQLGGSDQWGNITAGLELIRRKVGTEHGAYALSAPLILDNEGRKFGKSVDGALWIDEAGLSPYKLHQYLLNTNDNDIERYLKIFTDRSLEEIEQINRDHSASPESRVGQSILADDLVTLIHGPQAVTTAKKSASVLFGGTLQNLSANELEGIFEDVPSCSMKRDEVVGHSIVDVITNAQIVKSKGEARRLIKQGGVYMNNVRVDDDTTTISNEVPIENYLLLFRLGKKNYTLIKLSS
jgi:tyrosyl-tRNA synthetase